MRVGPVRRCWRRSSGSAPRNALVAQRPPDPTIDTVIIVSHNVFDPPDGTPHFVAHLGNALHITTHPAVIRRLLLLNAGMPLDSARLLEAERYLRELGVFRAVRLDTHGWGTAWRYGSRRADGWSTSPQLNFASAAGSTTWSAALVEKNFLGTATFVSVAYGRNPDRRSFDVQFRAPGSWPSRPTDRRLQQSVRRPTGGVELGCRSTAATRVGRWSRRAAANHRVLEFRNGALFDSTQQRALSFILTGGVALHATGRGYMRLWAGAAGGERTTSGPWGPRPRYSGFGRWVPGSTRRGCASRCSST